MLNVYTSNSSSFAAEHARRPLVVYIFGGAWRMGDRNQVESWMNLTRLTDAGYVVAGLDYRLSTDATFPAQIEDVWDGIRWLTDHADRYDIDNSRIGVVGPSAGGHLAALAGATSGTNTFGSTAVHAVVDFYGPTDFLQMDTCSISDTLIHDNADSPESMLVGGCIQQHPDRVAAANPISYISATTPPFLIVHGGQDPLVPWQQSAILADALQRARVPVEFVRIKDGGHGGFESPDWLTRVTAFFDANLK